MLRAAISQATRKCSNACSVKCKRLEGKVAIVTGSTNGIGLSIAKRLAQEGAKVMINSRKESNVKKAVDELKCAKLQVAGAVCHVGKSADRKNLLEKTKTCFGGLDILVCNAAVSPALSTTMETTEKLWDKIFDTNVKSTFLFMKESLPFLKCSKSPSIIIVTSVAAYHPIDLYQSETTHDSVVSNISMGRTGTPDEIAGVAAFLASDDASYITGESIVVAGGMKSRL
ncbi:PREDICTED: dehydrogenase/reductase SDR family member 4-like [Dinoponera quadriceps]|uniref:Dehydrogenase/reductase SDR family member 4-like n=1 Tax=Dinoponera quadriceps TaxID=609295 RepID=A0A6P3YEI5_DINQU|nr:PREDICTED: dehydrogenase/reductase SDR family member 4-like [Dinoponera quadriceps]